MRKVGRHLLAPAAIVVAACASRPPPPPPPAPALAPPVAAPVVVATPTARDWRTPAAAYLDHRVREDLEHPLRISMLKQQLDCAANCHTTLPYLTARPLLPGAASEPDAVRRAVAERVAGVRDWSSATPWFAKSDKIARWSRGSEAVTDAAALVDDDLSRGRPLSAEALRALDLMWSQQRGDGAWDWFGFGMEPWETNDDCGAALAANVVARLPADVRARAREHVDRLASYVRGRIADAAHPPALHQKVHFLRAATSWPELLDAAQRGRLADEIVARQRPDGGWSLATWGGGELADPNGASDGYATAIATLALCETRLAPASAARGVDWLGRSQRPDGAWQGRSVNEHDELLDKFESDMATSFAVIALTRCGPGAQPAAPPATPPPAGASAWSLLVRTLPGTWTMATKKGPFTVSYKLISGGSALVEQWGAGTPSETETVFHPDHADLLLVHYCAQGNQPRLRATASTADGVDFSFVDVTNREPSQAMLVERRLRFAGDSFDDTEVYRQPDGSAETTTYHFTRAAR